jgi:hypothetical protein
MKILILFLENFFSKSAKFAIFMYKMDFFNHLACLTIADQIGTFL